MRFVVINLERSGERREAIQQHLKDFDYELFPAIDGAELALAPVTEHKDLATVKDTGQTFLVDSSRRLDYAKRGKLTPQQIACALSHILVYKQLLEDPHHDAYVVCEDDAQPNVSAEVINTYLSNVPMHFDVIHVNKSQWWPLQCAEPVNDYYSKIEKQFFSCAATYIVSKQGARKIMVATHDGTHVTRPADDLLSILHVANIIDVLTTPNVELFRCGTFPSTIS